MKTKLLLAVATALVACSSTPTSNPPVDAGGGMDSGGGDTGGGGYKLSGKVVDFSSMAGVKGATVLAGATNMTTSDAMGAYSLSVNPMTPFSQTTSANTYVTLIEQEVTLTGDTTRNISLVGSGLQGLVAASLMYDTALAVVSFQVIATGMCASANGATVTLDPPGTEKLAYFKGGTPSPSTMAVIDGEVPSGIFYNVPLTTNVKFKVTHPTCKQVAYPVADPKIATVSYTGNVTIAASTNTVSFARVFIQ